MNRNKHLNQFLIVALIGLVSLAHTVHARVPYPVHSTYEDTLRVVLLSNNSAQGSCVGMPHVGIQTLDTVVAALDTTKVRNVRILPMGTATIDDVLNLWSGRKPHVIVNVNAGWGLMGDSLRALFQWASSNYIGLVEIGDDASGMTMATFGFKSVDNMPEPMGDALWLRDPDDSLWIRVQPGKDVLIDSTRYPYLTGVVRNATLKVMQDSSFEFKPVISPLGPGARRCQADADRYTIDPGFEDKVVFLGYQQGWNARADTGNKPMGYVGAKEQWNVIGVFQDSIMTSTGLALRRGVALSFQPQFIKNSAAARQLVYDAIVFASLTNIPVSPPRRTYTVAPDTVIIAAGERAILTAAATGSISDAADLLIAQKTVWSLDSRYARPGDSLLSTTGRQIQVTATQAFRSFRVVAAVYDSIYMRWITDSVLVRVEPGSDCRVWIERTSSIPVTQGFHLFPRTHADSITPHPIHQIFLDSSQTCVYAYAVVRDCFGNWKRLATNASWQDLPPAGAISAAPNPGRLWEGVITRTGSGNDSIRVWEHSPASIIGDTVMVSAFSGTPLALRLVDAEGNPLSDLSIGIGEQRLIRAQCRWAHAPDHWSDYVPFWEWSRDSFTGGSLPQPGSASTWSVTPQTAGTAELTIRDPLDRVRAALTIVVSPSTGVLDRALNLDRGSRNGYREISLWVPARTRHVRVEMLDVNGRLIASGQMSNPHPGWSKIPTPFPPLSRGLAVLRIWRTDENGTSIAGTTKCLLLR